MAAAGLKYPGHAAGYINTSTVVLICLLTVIAAYTIFTFKTKAPAGYPAGAFSFNS
jgi:hypothetical protein